MGTREARVLSNPLRVQILGTITTEPATTTQLATRIGAPLASVGYHTRVLCRSGCIRTAAGFTAESVTNRLYEAGH